MAKARFDLTESHTTDVRGVGTIIPVTNADGTRGSAVYARNVTGATTAVGDCAFLGVEETVAAGGVAEAIATASLAGQLIGALGVIIDDSYGWWSLKGHTESVKGYTPDGGATDIAIGMPLKGVNGAVHLVKDTVVSTNSWIALTAIADDGVGAGVYAVIKAYKAP